MQNLILSSFSVKISISDPLFIIILIAVFIAASVISGIITFKVKMKKIRNDTENKNNSQQK